MKCAMFWYSSEHSNEALKYIPMESTIAARDRAISTDTLRNEGSLLAFAVHRVYHSKGWARGVGDEPRVCLLVGEKNYGQGSSGPWFAQSAEQTVRSATPFDGRPSTALT